MAAILSSVCVCVWGGGGGGGGGGGVNVILLQVLCRLIVVLLKSSLLNKLHIIQCVGKIFCVECQGCPLKLHTKYVIYTLKDWFLYKYKLYRVKTLRLLQCDQCYPRGVDSLSLWNNT